MIAIDTSVLVRYITQDDPAQARLASDIIEQAAASSEVLFLSPPALCERTWVLLRAYRFSKEQPLQVLDTLLAVGAFELAERALVVRAVEAYRAGGAGFADELIAHYAWAAKCTRLVTFDKRLAASDPRAALAGIGWHHGSPPGFTGEAAKV